MNLMDVQVDNLIVENIINSLNSDAAFNTFLTFVGMVAFIQEALERYREKKWKKTFVEAVFLSVVMVILCQIGSFFQAILFISIMVLGATFWKRIKRSNSIRVNINNKPDGQIKDMLADSVEKEYVRQISAYTYKNL